MFYGVEILYVNEQEIKLVSTFNERHEAITFKDEYSDDKYCSGYLKNTEESHIWEFYEIKQESNWLLPNRVKERLKYKIIIIEIIPPNFKNDNAEIIKKKPKKN